ncbi:hypothetical protein DFJ58DRAFT_736362 [Suillus subalutaceus]|uniref:uncharacterized protein n=1 Tax=Suillus subalutaceus TaxID=48586 RepID=UPI001B87177A|nr:uncharacterized protein DFJ58DRAFT_736362 [Suillus subalutaceus]KAG1832358.1 hypothetical protein DFJ58DRAFT_736362 [Suillus subalutaceus]
MARCVQACKTSSSPRTTRLSVSRVLRKHPYELGVKWNKQALTITSKATWFGPEWSVLQRDHWEVVAGSWLVIPHISGPDILCYDLERGLRHVVYHADGAQILSFKSATSEAAGGGCIMHAIVMEGARSSPSFSHKLLSVRFSSDGPLNSSISSFFKCSSTVHASHILRFYAREHGAALGCAPRAHRGGLWEHNFSTKAAQDEQPITMLDRSVLNQPTPVLLGTR